MIPKDTFQIFISSYIKLKLKREVGPSVAMGQTVRPLLADCPPGRCGPSSRLVEKRCSSGRSGSNNGPSTLGGRTVRAPRGLSTGASRTVHRCRAPVGPRPQDENEARLLLFPNPTQVIPFLSFLLPLKDKASLLGFRLEHSPDRPGTSPDSPRDSPPCHPGIFFKYLILSLGF
jgi:hypothetical protein